MRPLCENISIYFLTCARLELFCDLIGCTSGRLFTISWPTAKRVIQIEFIFFKELNDNVKIKMFSDDSSNSESEFYRDEFNFLENEPASDSAEITSDIQDFT